jgi:hypothetical protein
MKLTCYEIKSLPIVIIDDFYTDSSCEKIWQELEFLNNDPIKFKSPEETGSAFSIVNNEQVYSKQNVGIFLDSVYSKRETSNILTENRKIFSNKLVDELVNHHIIFRYLRTSNIDTTVIQYYENSCYYKEHIDHCAITAVCWFYKLPKLFTGGELTFENGLSIDCLYNRIVVFPSVLAHSVEQVFVDTKLIGKNFGRYSITQLIGVR